MTKDIQLHFTKMDCTIRVAQSSLPYSVILKLSRHLPPQDDTAYGNEAADNFIMPLDRYPRAFPFSDVYPGTDQVLALRIKVQTAQQFGMIMLPARDRLIITSGVPIRSVVGAMDHKGRNLDVNSFTTWEWKPLSSPREQSPCQRGICYLPSPEVFHAYRVPEEHSDGITEPPGIACICSKPTQECKSTQELLMQQELTLICYIANSRAVTSWCVER